MILKSYIVEKNIDVLKDYQATLVYGQNSGLKDDIKQALKEKNRSSEIISFFGEEIIKNKNIIYENIVNESLFNEKKIIFIQEASDKIYNEISECLEKENKNIKIYIFSEVLDKKSKLRNLFEKKNNLAIFPCYHDSEQTLIAYVNKELKEHKGLSGEIINLIIYNSYMDRKIIKDEINKIKNFFVGKKINKEEILEIMNVKSDTSFDDIRDNALNGEKVKINKLLSEINIVNDDIFFYLNNLNNRISILQEIMKTSATNKEKFEQTLENFKKPIFWKDKPVIKQQLKKWDLKKLNEIAGKISKTEVLMKKNSYLRNDVLIKDLIVDLTCRATSAF